MSNVTFEQLFNFLEIRYSVSLYLKTIHTVSSSHIQRIFKFSEYFQSIDFPINKLKLNKVTKF